MPKPNVFISHRWDYNSEYYSLVQKFDHYGLDHLDYSVPRHDPSDVSTTQAIARTLAEQVPPLPAKLTPLQINHSNQRA